MSGLSVPAVLGWSVGAGLGLVTSVVVLYAVALVGLTAIGQWSGRAARLAARLAQPHRAYH